MAVSLYAARYVTKLCTVRHVTGLSLYLTSTQRQNAATLTVHKHRVPLVRPSATIAALQPDHYPLTVPLLQQDPSVSKHGRSYKGLEAVCREILDAGDDVILFGALDKQALCEKISLAMRIEHPNTLTSSYLVALKLRALNDWGLSLTQVLENPTLLILDYDVLLHKGHVEYFKLLRNPKHPKLLIQLLANRLGVMVEDLDGKVAKFPKKWKKALKRFEELNRKITLLSEKFSFSEINAHQRVLRVDMGKLKWRLKHCENLPEVKLYWICESETKFHDFVEKSVLKNLEKTSDTRFNSQVLEIAHGLGKLDKIERIAPKIQFLLQKDFSNEDIISKPNLVHASVIGLAQRFELLEQKDIALDTILKYWRVLLLSSARLDFGLQKVGQRASSLAAVLRTAKEFESDENRLLEIGKIFGIEETESERLFKNIPFKSLKTKLKLLEDFGISKNDVLNNPEIVRIGIRKLKENVAIYDKKEEIIDHLRSIKRKYIPNLNSKRKLIARLLQCPKNHLDQSWPALTPALQTDDEELKNIVKFLLEYGFSIEDLRHCPMILNHSVKSISDNIKLDDIQMFSDDKVKQLNAICYCLESHQNLNPFDMDENFVDDTSFHAEDSDNLNFDDLETDIS